VQARKTVRQHTEEVCRVTWRGTGAVMAWQKGGRWLLSLKGRTRSHYHVIPLDTDLSESCLTVRRFSVVLVEKRGSHYRD
jgi:hypothetical protein